MRSEPDPSSLDDPTVSSANTANQKKRILVVLLLGGLLLAILTQPDHAGDDQGTVVDTKWSVEKGIDANTIAVRDNADDLAANIDLLETLAIKQNLSRLTLDEISQLEILAPTSGIDNRDAARSNRRVQAIYQTTNGRAAILDHSIVHDGQSLPEGGKVVNITTDGIEVSR